MGRVVGRRHKQGEDAAQQHHGNGILRLAEEAPEATIAGLFGGGNKVRLVRGWDNLTFVFCGGGKRLYGVRSENDAQSRILGNKGPKVGLSPRVPRPRDQPGRRKTSLPAVRPLPHLPGLGAQEAIQAGNKQWQREQHELDYIDRNSEAQADKESSDSARGTPRETDRHGE